MTVKKVTLRLTDANGQLLSEQVMDDERNLGQTARFALPAKTNHHMLLVTCIVEYVDAAGKLRVNQIIKKILVN